MNIKNNEFNRRKRWSSKDIEFVMNSNISDDELSVKLGRSVSAIKQCRIRHKDDDQIKYGAAVVFEMSFDGWRWRFTRGKKPGSIKYKAVKMRNNYIEFRNSNYMLVWINFIELNPSKIWRTAKNLFNQFLNFCDNKPTFEMASKFNKEFQGYDEKIDAFHII